MSDVLDKKGLTEAEFLRRYDPDKYPKPSLTADIAVFRVTDPSTAELLLVRRGGHPFLGYWALPGGFAERDEALEDTAARELREETGVTDVRVTLTGIYSTPGRDPRGWVVSAAFAAVVPPDTKAAAGDDAADVRWVPLGRGADGALHLAGAALEELGGRLAFDHDRIVKDAICAVLPRQ